MATNDILDITTEEYMGQDPEMQIDQDEMLHIINTLQVIGVPQDKHPEVLEAFKEWKQTKNGTIDMFLEESFQLEPGTITKIKEQKQVAQGPQDMPSEDDMTVQPGSGDMLEIMQSVGAPQRAAQGGRIGLGRGGNAFWDDKSWEEFDTYNDETETGRRYLDETDAVFEKFAERFPSIDTTEMDINTMIAMLQAEGIMDVEGLGLAGLDKSMGMITPESVTASKAKLMQQMAHGGRIGYQGGEQVLPMPRPTEEDTRLEFFKRMGAMPEQTLLRQAQPMNAMSGQMRGQGEGIMGQTQDPFGGLLGGQEGDIGRGGQPLVEYEHEGAEPEPSWWDRAKTGTYDGSQDHSIDMEMIIDFLKKMGMAITQENIAKAAKALGMAMKFAPGVGGAAGLGIAGLQSLGGPGEEEIEETETEAMFQDGGAVPRQGYGLGSIIKSITSAPKKILKSAKKILKSDLGKMAMMYIATAGLSNIGASGGWSNAKWAKPFAAKTGWLNPGTVYGNIGKSLSGLTDKLKWGKDVVKPGVESGTGVFEGVTSNKDFWANAGKTLPFGSEEVVTNLATNAAKNPAWYKGALPWIGGASVLGGLYTAANPGDVQFDTDKRDAEVADVTKWLASIQPKGDIDWPYPDYTGAQGGRVGRQEGGIMDLDGGEKDYRNTGGFVDIGAKEKADDVPARLSVNEFVMTADAVRGAGDGDVEEGAERLQDTMKQLEQKGKRHKAAQGMFATSQRLGEVI